MWLKWLPWRYVLSRVAKSHGFIDPVALLSRLHAFTQPSEVAEPLELLRAGMIFHARGLINTRTIQHNLDWVWPFWIERQFDPHDRAFIPRAFTITHVNLTHRNWTAVGIPDCDQFPIVDPRGLVTPLLDGWSLDTWLLGDTGPPLYPSRAPAAHQQLTLDPFPAVKTYTQNETGSVASTVDVIVLEGGPVCRLRVTTRFGGSGWLVVALRPANPEGVSFVHRVEYEDSPSRWLVNGQEQVQFDRSPDRVCMSRYRDGDVAIGLGKIGLGSAQEKREQKCEVGLCTAAALYRLTGRGSRHLSVTVPLASVSAITRDARSHPRRAATAEDRWKLALADRCHMETPDERINALFDKAIYGLVLHSPGEVFPGPYTYKRFWFRDAAFILHALLVVNQHDRVEQAIARYPRLQTSAGYFRSQDGEWDSNGAAIWLLDRFRCLSGRSLSAELVRAVEKGAQWIVHKRMSDDLADPHAGLMPAGFSAEHLGPNDYYYWDDFWSAAGLRSAAAIVRAAATNDSEERLEARTCSWEREATKLLTAVDRSLMRTAARRDFAGIPASPYRRLDSGAIGSLACSYPLQLWEPSDDRLLTTVDFLLERCSVRGGFFQDMIHSGINPYLTLHIAQVLLRSHQDWGERGLKLLHVVRDLASPTGQWPEAIHPRTGGGCMGDGQHLWAAAEWVLLLRNMFVREEQNTLILAGGIPLQWLDSGTLRCGPTATSFGQILVELAMEGDQCVVKWTADWRTLPEKVSVQLPGCQPASVAPRAGRWETPLASWGR